MRTVNIIDDDNTADEDMPRAANPSHTGNQNMCNGNTRDLQQGSFETSVQHDEDTFEMHRYGLRLKHAPTKMAVSIAGKPGIANDSGHGHVLTSKIHCAYFWKSLEGAQNCAVGYKKRYNIDLVPFKVESVLKLSEVSE